MRSTTAIPPQTSPTPVVIAAGAVHLMGELDLPSQSGGLVVFAHGSGASRRSSRHQFVARSFRRLGLGTLLFDLLTQEEECLDSVTGALCFDIELLAARLLAATHWIARQPATSHRKIGYFGASTGGAAALVAAANAESPAAAVVVHSARPDLAADHLPKVTSPTLLILGDSDEILLTLNRDAYSRLTCPKQLVIIPESSNQFSEPGKLEEMTAHSAQWFNHYLGHNQ